MAFVPTVVTSHNAAIYSWFILPFFMIGFGPTFTMPAATMIVLHAVPTNRAGITYAAGAILALITRSS